MRGSQRRVSVGDIVLVGTNNNNNEKRIHWLLGHMKELVHVEDGKVRLLKLQTSHSEILRSIQKIYPLEVSSTDSAENIF